MNIKTINEIVETTEHPLEEFFDIDPGTTEVVSYEQKTELVKAEEYDQKDDEIEQNFQDIYDKSISAYQNMQEQMDDIDPRYMARVQEVANQLLNTATAAAALKLKLKEHKDKLMIAKNKLGGAAKTNQPIIIDTNALIEQLKAQSLNKSDPIDITPENNNT